VDADELVIWTDVDGIYTANPNECAERAFCMSSAMTKPTPLLPAAQKFSTKKCCPWPLKPKWSSGFVTLSIRKPAAHASVHRVPSDIRKQRHSMPL